MLRWLFPPATTPPPGPLALLRAEESGRSARPATGLLALPPELLCIIFEWVASAPDEGLAVSTWATVGCLNVACYQESRRGREGFLDVLSCTVPFGAGLSEAHHYPPAVRHLHLHPGARVPLGHLALLRNLTDLRLNFLASREMLASLAALRQLRCLDLAGCFGLTDEAVAGLAAVGTLRELSLSDRAPCSGLLRAARVTDVGLLALGALPLEKLALSRTDVSAASLSGFAGSLRDLSLKHCWQVARLPALPRLRRLHVRRCGELESPEAVRTLVAPPLLVDLTLDWRDRERTARRGAELGALDPPPGLRRFVLRGVPVADRLLSDLATLPELRHLTLEDARGPTTEAGLARLGAARRLETLRLAGFDALSDRCLAAWAPLQQLRALELSRCGGVSDLGALAACAALEGVSVSLCPAVPEGTLRDGLWSPPSRSDVRSNSF